LTDDGALKTKIMADSGDTFNERYQKTGMGATGDPHIEFKLGPCGSSSSKVVAKAVINVLSYPSSGGGGVGLGGYDGGAGGCSAPQLIVVSVNAQSLQTRVDERADDPSAVVTTMYRYCSG
jgi:hypothetical protein